MLFEELDRITKQIQQLDAQKQASAFLDQMIAHHAAVLEQFDYGPTASGAERMVLLGIAAGCILKLVEPLPAIIRQLSAVVRNVAAPPHLRCAIAGGLGYLVQPIDLIPDETPGGYGFVDDAVLLHATRAAYLQAISDNVEETEGAESRMRLAAAICPPAVIKSLDQALERVVVGFRALVEVPDDMLLLATEKIIADPFQASVPMPQGTSTSMMAPLGLRKVIGMRFSVQDDQVVATFGDGRTVAVSG